MRKERLLAYGDIDMDVIVKTTYASDTEADEKVDGLFISPGGSATNCAVIACSLGLPTTFLGILGDDHWSKLLDQDLKKHRVNTRFLHRVPGQLAICISILNQAGDRKFYSYRGVNATSTYSEIPAAIFKRHTLLHLSGYSFQTPNSAAFASRLLHGAKEHGLRVSLDPSFLFAKEIDLERNDLLKHVDYFFPSREEAYQLTKLRDPIQAARKIKANGPRVVIVTLDKEGCLVVGDGVESFIKLEHDEPVVDTTGAGDAFCGGFLMGVTQGLLLEQACKVGSASAAHIIARYGAHESPPSLDDIVRILRYNKEEELIALLKKSFRRGKFWRKS
jgi:sugar/nucleoside kinase (ribokinase family)